MIKMLRFHASYYIAPHTLYHIARGSFSSYTLDHAEPELEVQAEQAQTEDLTNLALGSRQALLHHSQSLTFVLNLYLYVKNDCALG
jgi:hypothetical protein